MKKIVSAVRIALLAVLGLSVGTAATSSASIPLRKALPRCHNARICSAPTPGTGPAPGRSRRCSWRAGTSSRPCGVDQPL